jgi:hypothetical protein
MKMNSVLSLRFGVYKFEVGSFMVDGVLFGLNRDLGGFEGLMG